MIDVVCYRRAYCRRQFSHMRLPCQTIKSFLIKQVNTTDRGYWYYVNILYRIRNYDFLKINI